MGGRCRRLGWPSCCRRGPPSCRYLQGPVRGSAVATPVNGDSDVARDLPASFKTMLQVAYSVFLLSGLPEKGQGALIWKAADWRGSVSTGVRAWLSVLACLASARALEWSPRCHSLVAFSLSPPPLPNPTPFRSVHNTSTAGTSMLQWPMFTAHSARRFRNCTYRLCPSRFCGKRKGKARIG